MTVIPRLIARDSEGDDGVSMSPTMMKLLIALVVLFALCFLCVGLLLMLRSYRQKKYFSTLTTPNRPSSKISHRRRGAATAPLQIEVREKEKEMLVGEKEPPSPESPVPEIRVTFPDEDERGAKRKSQVMVLKMSERGAVGLEPYHEEPLPPYQKTDQGFQSLDLEKLGGLREKKDANRF